MRAAEFINQRLAALMTDAQAKADEAALAAIMERRAQRNIRLIEAA
jgi:hypothetical protein